MRNEPIEDDEHEGGRPVLDDVHDEDSLALAEEYKEGRPATDDVRDEGCPGLAEIMTKELMRTFRPEDFGVFKHLSPECQQNQNYGGFAGDDNVCVKFGSVKFKGFEDECHEKCESASAASTLGLVKCATRPGISEHARPQVHWGRFFDSLYY